MSRSHPDHVPVVVVGAGPTGTCAAIALGGLGVPTLVLDRWADVYPQPRAVHLDDEVYRVLDGLGVGERFAEISRPCAGLRLVDASLGVLGEFPRGEVSPAHGYPRANMFDQPALERLLRDQALAQAEVRLVGGVEVTAVEPHGDTGATVTYRDVRSGVERVVEADVVLGCDGANSVVRQAVGARLDDLGFTQRWLVIDVETGRELGHWDGVHQVCDSSRAATYMRIGATRHRWEFRLLDGEGADAYGTIAALEPLLRPWVGGAPIDDLTLLRSREYTFRAAVADRWRAGSVFLLGDAAHLTPPFIGQGLGAGVRDAVNLAWKVAGFLDGSLPREVLETYEPERSAHARAMVQRARAMGVAMTSGGAAADAARRLVLPTLSRIPAVRRKLADSTTPRLRSTSWCGGVSDRRGDRLAGSLCPDGELGGRRFDEAVGARWAVVTSVAIAPSDATALRERGCRVVRAERGDALGRWLDAGGATTAVVRPDRVVAASGVDVPALCAALTSFLAPPSTGLHASLADDVAEALT